MSVEVDRRDFRRVSRGANAAELMTRAALVSAQLPGEHAVAPSGVHPFTGMPQRLLSTASLPPVAPPPDAAGESLVARAVDHLRRVEAALARPGDVLEWVPEPRVHRTSSGTQLVHLHQVYRGVPVFEAMRTVRFDSAGAVAEVSGDHVPLPDGLDFAPHLSAADAILAAGRHLARELDDGLRVTRHPPRRVAALPLPASPGVYEKRPFEKPVPVHLCLFDLGRDVRLAWFMAVRLPELRGSYDLLMDAGAPGGGDVLWCRCTSAHDRPARGMVFLHDPDEGQRREADMPPALTALPPLRPRRTLPEGYPHPWVADRSTSGNNAVSRRDGRRVLQGTLSGGKAVFRPAAAQGVDQRVLNAFYHVSYLHDFFYLLGFDEMEGNFEEANPPGVPGGRDRVEIGIYPVVLGVAMMDTTADGTPPRLLLGTGDRGRHTALSADVVIHELVHGVTDRIVGGRQVVHPMSRTLQSRALDEGTCDYFALTMQNYQRLQKTPPQPERLVYGDWIGGAARRSYANVGLRFGDLDGVREPHRAGQVWGAALLAVNRGLGRAMGDAARGHEIGWQLVVDALKLLEVTPLSVAFLTARDRLFEAFELMKSNPPAMADGQPLLPPDRHEAAEAALRGAFLSLGMGPGAASTGPDFDGVVGDPQ